MKEIEFKIAEWILPYATIIGNGISVEKKLRQENEMKYFLHLTIPNIFDSYAVILSPFWINYKLKDNQIRIVENDDEDLPEEDFTKISWEKFFEIKGEKFLLKDLYSAKEKVLRQNQQYTNELYPGEGMCETEHLEFFANNIIELNGDENVFVFYTFLATKDWDNDFLYSGKISELSTLIKNENFRLSPSLIYPESKRWVLNCDYDLPFTFIGGEKKLIQKMINKFPDEVYKLEY